MRSHSIFGFWASIFLCHTSAVPFQGFRKAIQLGDTTTIGISEDLFDNFKMFANFTAASYCPSNENSKVDSLITCPGSICPRVEVDNVTAVVEFGGENDTTLVDIKGFVALDPTRSLVVVSFAGSGATIRNWLDDFTFAQVLYAILGCTNCWVHSGFFTGWSERRTIVLDAVTTALSTHANSSLIITGHSIGAGIATLAAAELRNMNYSADTYTYGSPRVGNTAFATFVTDQAPELGRNYRMTHVNDPVPQLPPTWIGYEHTSPEYWLANGTDTTDDYSAGDVVLCEGVGNESCNAGTGLVPVDGTAHDHYLGAIDAGQGSFEW